MGKFNISSSIIDLAKEVLNRALFRSLPVILPIDLRIAGSLNPEASTKVVLRSCVPDGYEGVDIGPITLKEFKELIHRAKIIFWNGPVGVYEVESFFNGTKEIAKAVAGSTAIKIAGGGDTVAAIEKAGKDIKERMNHLSTGGGATLEFLAGKELPGITSLK
jgi:phosphoglycerate kinase